MTDEDLSPDEEQLLVEYEKKQRAVEYLRGVASLNLEIVDTLRGIFDGLSMEAIVERFQEHSRQKITHALESAIEDEYIERISKDCQEWYRAIPLEEP